MKRVTDSLPVVAILAVAAALAATYVDNQSADLKAIAFWGLSALVAFWFIAWLLLHATDLLYFGRGRYAVLLFVLDQRLRLLLVMHPFHRRRIPPGGRLRLLELPHDAVIRVMREEAGLALTGAALSAAFHEHEHALTDVVTVLPAPFTAQREDRRQRGFVRFHYAFTYVLEVSSATPLGGNAGYDPHWYSLEEIEQMHLPERPFDDIIERYKSVLGVFGRGGRGT